MHEDEYWAFISYSFADERAANRVQRDLERYRIRQDVRDRSSYDDLPPSLRPVFLFRTSMPPGQGLDDSLRRALDRSRHLVLLCSPAAAASAGVAKEVEYFKRTGRGERIIPVILSGEPGGEVDECFPPALYVEYDAQGNEVGRGAPPVGIDARGDRFRSALTKVLAGLLGVSPDFLDARARRYQRRRRMVWVAGAAIFLAIVTGLWIRAEVQKGRAEAGERAATQNEARLLAARSRDLTDAGSGRAGIQAALRGLEARDRGAYVFEADAALYHSILQNRSVALAPDDEAVRHLYATGRAWPEPDAPGDPGRVHRVIYPWGGGLSVHEEPSLDRGIAPRFNITPSDSTAYYHKKSESQLVATIDVGDPFPATALSPDERYLLVGNVGLLDLDRRDRPLDNDDAYGDVYQEGEGHRHVHSIDASFSPDGRFALLRYNDDRVVVFASATGLPQASLEQVRAAAFVGSGTLAVLQLDGRVCAVALRGRDRGRSCGGRVTHPVTHFRVSPTGRSLLVASAENGWIEVSHFDTASARQIGHYEAPYLGPPTYIAALDDGDNNPYPGPQGDGLDFVYGDAVAIRGRSSAVVFSASERPLGLRSEGGAGTLTRLDEPEHLRGVIGYSSDPVSETVSAVTRGGDRVEWDARTGRVFYRRPLLPNWDYRADPAYGADPFVLHPRLIAGATWANSHETDHGLLLHRSGHSPSPVWGGLASWAHTGNHFLMFEQQYWMAAFHPERSWLVTGAKTDTVRVWDHAEELVPVWERPLPGHLTSAAFSSDGRYLIAAVADTTGTTRDQDWSSFSEPYVGGTSHIRVHDTEGWGLVWRSPTFPGGATQISAGPSARLVLVDARGGGWMVFDRLKGSAHPVGLPDGCDDDESWFELNDSDDYRNQYLPQIHTSVTSGGAAIVDSRSCGLMVWRPSGVTSFSSDGVDHVSLSPDGGHVVVGRDNGDVVLWDVDHPDVPLFTLPLGAPVVGLRTDWGAESLEVVSASGALLTAPLLTTTERRIEVAERLLNVRRP